MLTFGRFAREPSNALRSIKREKATILRVVEYRSGVDPRAAMSSVTYGEEDE